MVTLFSYLGGQKWGRMEDGRIVSPTKPDSHYTFTEHKSDVKFGDDVQCDVILYEYRTRGLPLTAHNALQDFGAAMLAASVRFGVPFHVIFATICIEATKWKDDKSHFDSRCVRFEPGYVSDKKTPNKISPGLMQTLLSTAQEVNDRFKIYTEIGGLVEHLTREDLYIAEKSIFLGTAYLRAQFSRVEPDEAGFDVDDPVLAWSAYNAGSVKKDSSNPWNLLTYGGDRIDKAIAYNNDMIALIKTLSP